MNRTAAFLRAVLLENWGLKLLSLILGLLLWMFVVGEKRSEVAFTIPLEFTGMPDQLVIVNRVPEAIQVRLSGPRTLLASIQPNQLSVALDLRDLQPGRSTFENLASRVQLPKRIEVTYISPAAVTLDAVPKVRKTVRILPRVRGEPAPGFRAEGLEVTPETVELEGPRAVLDGVDAVATEIVDVSGLDHDLDRPVELVLPDPSLHRTTRPDEHLRVSIRSAARRDARDSPPEALP